MIAAHRRALSARTLLAVALTALLGLMVLLPGAADARGDRHGSTGHRGRNVILLIGDGMDAQAQAAARYYEYGAAGHLVTDRITDRGDVTTWSVTEDDPDLPDYDPDSASTATAWSTGSKTSDGRISTTAGDLDHRG